MRMGEGDRAKVIVQDHIVANLTNETSREGKWFVLDEDIYILIYIYFVVEVLNI